MFVCTTSDLCILSEISVHCMNKMIADSAIHDPVWHSSSRKLDPLGSLALILHSFLQRSEQNWFLQTSQTDTLSYQNTSWVLTKPPSWLDEVSFFDVGLKCKNISTYQTSWFHKNHLHVSVQSMLHQLEATTWSRPMRLFRYHYKTASIFKTQWFPLHQPIRLCMSLFEKIGLYFSLYLESRTILSASYASWFHVPERGSYSACNQSFSDALPFYYKLNQLFPLYPRFPSEMWSLILVICAQEASWKINQPKRPRVQTALRHLPHDPANDTLAYTGQSHKVFPIWLSNAVWTIQNVISQLSVSQINCHFSDLLSE